MKKNRDHLILLVALGMAYEKLDDVDSAMKYFEHAVEARRLNKPPFDEQYPVDWIESHLVSMFDDSGMSELKVAEKMAGWNLLRENALRRDDHPVLAYGQLRLAEWKIANSIGSAEQELRSALGILQQHRFTPPHVIDKIKRLLNDSAQSIGTDSGARIE